MRVGMRVAPSPTKPHVRRPISPMPSSLLSIERGGAGNGATRVGAGKIFSEKKQQSTREGSENMPYTYVMIRNGWLISSGNPNLSRERFLPVSRSIIGMEDSADWPRRGAVLAGASA